jgi:hypothetical protein
MAHSAYAKTRERAGQLLGRRYERMGDQRRLPLRRGTVHSRGRPDERNSVPLPGLPEVHWQRLCRAGSVPTVRIIIPGRVPGSSAIDDRIPGKSA